MKYASVCSGVEAASLAWMPLGWKAAWFSEIEPFPCAVLKYRFPDVPNLGDMTKIKVENLENGDQKFTGGDGATVVVPGGIDLLVGGTPCFTAGAMVLTPAGYRPIETLRVGDKVVSHLGKVCEITATGNKIAEIGAISILGRSDIACTEDHPFYSVRVKRDCRRKSPTYCRTIADGDYEFCAAKDSVGRYAGRVLARPVESEIPEGIYNATADDIIELAGWYVGDGYIRRWTGKNKKAVIIALVSPGKISKFQQRFSGKFKFYTGKDGKIAITCTRLAEWLVRNFGEHAAEKRIPYWLYCHPLKSAFVSGYEITDGGFDNRDGSMRITTVSPALAYGIADLYEDASVYFTERPKSYGICGRTVNQRNFVASIENGHESDTVLCRATQQANAELLQECCPTITEAAGASGNNQPIICYDGRGNGDGETANCITGDHGDRVTDYTPLAILGKAVDNTEIMGINPINQEEAQYANAKKTRPCEILRVLRETLGEGAFRQWTVRRLGRIQEEEVLQSRVHGESVRCEACEEKSGMDDRALSRKEDDAENSLRYLWEQFKLGHSSQGRELAEQFTAELNMRLSRMPYKTAPFAQVRRLLPIEAERLMGFPDNWTRIPWKGKPAEECPDGPRYKACGNSMCVNVMRWIGMRIELAERKRRK